MHTAKETVRRLLDDLPDNASMEDIQYHIYVREKLERGLRDVEIAAFDWRLGSGGIHALPSAW